jgi:hypothetical protein
MPRWAKEVDRSFAARLRSLHARAAGSPCTMSAPVARSPACARSILPRYALWRMFAVQRYPAPSCHRANCRLNPAGCGRGITTSMWAPLAARCLCWRRSCQHFHCAELDPKSSSAAALTIRARRHSSSSGIRTCRCSHDSVSMRRSCSTVTASIRAAAVSSGHRSSRCAVASRWNWLTAVRCAPSLPVYCLQGCRNRLAGARSRHCVSAWT